MSDLFTQMETNHNLHGAIIGVSVYYFMNKQGSDKAVKYGVLSGVVSAFYMSKFGHSLDLNQNIFGEFNKVFADLTAT